MIAGDRTDTIHALASGPPPAGVAVVRVSGPLIPRLEREWIGRALEPRRATLASLSDEAGGVLDRALVLRFVAPHSFTGEDVMELHLHGGRAVVAAVEKHLLAFGSRPAEPGEFTMRAHLNGRIDLIETERLADLIEAETEAQRRFASSDRGRRNGAIYEEWRSRLIDTWALLEASLDFADEDDAPVEVADEVSRTVRDLHADIREHLAGARASEIVRDGYRLVLAGAPNAGKSSLLNALAERDIAIVTDVPGTTRDVLEVSLDVKGYKIIVSDTAGLRGGADRVETIGIERARETINRADGVLWLTAPDAPNGDTGMPNNVSEALPSVLRVATKRDLGGSFAPHDIAISVRTGEGLDALIARIAELVRARVPSEMDSIPIAARHERHCRACLAFLERAETGPVELKAEALRHAAAELGRITGSVDIENVYDAIFSRFCMGK